MKMKSLDFLDLVQWNPTHKLEASGFKTYSLEVSI